MVPELLPAPTLHPPKHNTDRRAPAAPRQLQSKSRLLRSFFLDASFFLESSRRSLPALILMGVGLGSGRGRGGGGRGWGRWLVRVHVCVVGSRVGGEGS